MARAQFYDCGIDSSGNFVTTTQCTVYERGTTNVVSIYDTESTGVLKSNPFISSTGFVTFWVDPGEYDIKVEDVNAAPSFTTRVIGWSSIPAVDGVTAETIADEAISWGNVGFNQDGFGYGHISLDTPLCVSNATTLINYVQNSKIITFTGLFDGEQNDYVDDQEIFDLSTGYFTPFNSGIYILNCEMEYTIQGGGKYPDIEIRHGNVDGAKTHYLSLSASVGNSYYKDSFSRVIALQANVTCYLKAYTTGTVRLDRGYLGFHMLSPAAQI